jgi:hypothetical protein
MMRLKIIKIKWLFEEGLFSKYMQVKREVYYLIQIANSKGQISYMKSTAHNLESSKLKELPDCRRKLNQRQYILKI